MCGLTSFSLVKLYSKIAPYNLEIGGSLCPATTMTTKVHETETQQLLRTAEVAASARVVGKTILRAVARGDLIAIRLGRNTLRFDPRDVAAWIDSGRGKGVAN